MLHLCATVQFLGWRPLLFQEAGSTKLLPLVLYPVEPTPSPGLVRDLHHPKKLLSHRLDTGKSENAALQSVHPVRLEIPPVDQGRHPHRNDETGRASGQEGTWEAPLRYSRASPGRITCSMNL